MSGLTPGKAGKLNTMKGISSILSFNHDGWEKLKNEVLAKGLFVYKEEDKTLYLTDGSSKLSALAAIADLEHAPLNDAAYNAIKDAFKSGSYAIAPNAVVTTGADSKLDDALFKFIDEDNIKVEYLSTWIDPATGLIRLEKLPDSMRAHVQYVANITERNAIPEERRTGLIFVIDAKDDPTVDAGSAMYLWVSDADVKSGRAAYLAIDMSTYAGGGMWVKIYEGESLDINLDELKPTAASVEAAGAVMYNHMVLLQAPTADELYNALKYVEPEEEKKTFAVALGSNEATAVKNGGSASITLNLSGTVTKAVTLKVTPNKCKIAGMTSSDTPRDDAYTFKGTVDQLKAEFKNLKAIAGTEQGTVTIHADDVEGLEGDHTDKTFTLKVEEPVPATLTVPEVPVTGATGSQQNLGVTVNGKQAPAVTLKLTPTGCELQGLKGRPDKSGEAYTKTGTIAEVNADISAAKIVIGAGNGSVKVDLTGGAGGQNKTITVNKQG